MKLRKFFASLITCLVCVLIIMLLLAGITWAGMAIYGLLA